ncbi:MULTISPECIES: hypothetical protein [unclassified Brenneria]|uniref:hypothetical protein n=1 Tax=unclassified Brenneria TaxID=2634434 RepID=UPI0029C2881B|nr:MULTISPECIES: hypothetical protein [unclassified Brenneria]MDX5627198.1 hypothetical protein [Brenneria sp. L3-3Z]MDX5694647.1 hypothetical protein [Brenneria sp. L4-2C]
MSLSHGINSPQFYFDSLMSSVDSCYQCSDDKQVIYLEAGHFNSRFGVDDFALNSLKDAVDFGSRLIKAYQKNVKLVYGILVDDLGMACSEESCTLTPPPEPDRLDSVGLPDELEAFIAASPHIKRDKLMIFSERTCKNRAIRNIKKKIKQGAEGLVITEDGEYSEIKIAPAGETPFLLARRQGSVYTAKCPAIIAQHYDDVLMKLKQQFFGVNKFMIIDWCEMSDRIKVIQGKSAFSILQDEDCLNAAIVNIFFGDEEGRIAEVKHSIALNHTRAEICRDSDITAGTQG